MKLYEILNQAKAVVEGKNIDETWEVLAPQVAEASGAIKIELRRDYDDEAAKLIYTDLVKNLMRMKEARRSR